MSETLEAPRAPADTRPLTLEQAQQFPYREARALDGKQWDDDDELVEDPQRDISLIYYPDRSGLEDRVFRIRTEHSSATSLPEPRTNHNISNVEIVSQDGAE